MESAVYSRVFGEPNILTEILARIGCTRSVSRSAAVHTSWREAVAAPDFADLYISRNAPSLLGFLVQFGGVFGLASQLVDPTPEPEGETAVARGAQIDRPSLEGDTVVASRGGYVLTESTEQPDGYYISFLCEQPKSYNYGAPPLQQIPRLPNQYSSNTYGQFGIMPDAGRGGMAFFALDYEGEIRRTCEGVSLYSQESVYAHVTIFTDGHWGDSIFSDPIQPKGRVVFHPSPYCFISLPQPRRRVKPGKYARSPFVMGYDPPTRAPADAVKIYAMFFKEKAEVDKDVWVISTAPKYVELTAGLLKNMLKKDGVVENELLTVLMRRYQQMDVSFARERGEGCWRFFMDPDFANHVMREDHLVTNPYIRDMFIGNHINFDVNLCTEFVLPVKFNFIWSTYIWDFIKKSIFVLDPTMNNGDESDKVLQANHRRVAQKLHHEIAKCIKAFFIGWSPEMDKWKTYFPRWTCPAISKRHHSGVYAAHFARYWMGKKLKRHLSEEQDDGVNQSKMGMLVDVLGLEGNIGQVPTRYRSCLPICSD